MRHAEAQPERFGLNDRDRCLSGGGMEELDLIRRKLQGKLQGLQLVLCSNVKRTRQTLEGIKPILPTVCEAAFDDDLYHASAASLINRLRGLEDTQDFVMVIAHNPGVSDFLNLVITSTKHQPGAPKMLPTSGVAILEGNFEGWQDASPARFTLQDFFVP